MNASAPHPPSNTLGVPASPSRSLVASLPSIPDAACGDQRAIMLRGVGKMSGDGWKDTTRIGEVVYAWNAEMPSPYAPGQFPRVGNVCGWCASVEQYEFRPATPLEMRAAVDAIAEERFSLRCEVNGYRTRVTRLESAINAMLTYFGMDEDEWSKPTFDQARAALREEHFPESAVSACWIGAEERKPPKHEEVLIAFRDVSLPATGQYTASPHDTWGWSFPSEIDPEETGPITHWMPLPLHPRHRQFLDGLPREGSEPKAETRQRLGAEPVEPGRLADAPNNRSTPESAPTGEALTDEQEREAFETWFDGLTLTLKEQEWSKAAAWTGWQARASLAATPSAEAQPTPKEPTP